MSSIENVAFHEEGESHEEEKVPKLKEANTEGRKYSATQQIGVERMRFTLVSLTPQQL